MQQPRGDAPSPLLSDRELRDLMRTMLLIREFDERAVDLRLHGSIYGVVHPYVGQEAVAVGVCAHLRIEDKIFTYHRGHGHSIAKGASITGMMAELMGRQGGVCRGKGGSMHIADVDAGVLGANGIVGAGIPQAVGAAYAAEVLATGSVTIVFFGDGAVAQGVFHESLNVASLWKLPVVFVCENNYYASGIPLSEHLANTDIATFATSYKIPGESVDGTDVLAVHAVAKRAIERARDGKGPTLIECRSYRQGAHVQRDTETRERRSAEEVATAKFNDPIERLEQRITGRVSEDDLAALRREVKQEIASAVEFALASPFPEPEEALRDLYSEEGPSSPRRA